MITIENYQYDTHNTSDIVLKEVIFKYCIFENVIFSDTDFTDIVFEDCIFKYCIFTDCLFTNLNIRRSVLWNVTITTCMFNNVSITENSNLTKIHCNSCIFKGNLLFLDIILKYSRIHNNSFTEAKWSKSYIKFTTFNQCRLDKCGIENCDVHSSEFFYNIITGYLYVAGSDFSGTQMSSDFDISKCVLTYNTKGIDPPLEGDLIGYKKVGDGLIVKLLIPKEAKRSKATTNKYRAEYAKVLSITPSGKEFNPVYPSDVNWHLHYSQFSINGPVLYKVGEFVYPDKWDDDQWTVCSHGIHFFLHKYQAELW